MQKGPDVPNKFARFGYGPTGPKRLSRDEIALERQELEDVVIRVCFHPLGRPTVH